MERNLLLDLLKLLLAFMVVGIHAEFLIEVSKIGSYLLTQGIFRIAVPLFLIINGYFFYKIIFTGIKKWLLRLFILYMFWMFFYSYAWYSIDINQSFMINVFHIVKKVLVGYHHLWYIPATIGAGILLYFLRHLSDKSLIFIGSILYIMGMTIQYTGSYHYFENIFIDGTFNKLHIYRNFLFMGFPFFLVGYLVAKKNIKEMYNIPTLLFLILLGFVLLLFEANYNFQNLQMNNTEIKPFDLLFSLLFICTFIFLLILKLPIKSKNRQLTVMATAVYFIHPFFLAIVLESFEFTSILKTLFAILLSLLASIVLIYLNKQIKWIL